MCACDEIPGQLCIDHALEEARHEREIEVEYQRERDAFANGESAYDPNMGGSDD